MSLYRADQWKKKKAAEIAVNPEIQAMQKRMAEMESELKRLRSKPTISEIPMKGEFFRSEVERILGLGTSRVERLAALYGGSMSPNGRYKRAFIVDVKAVVDSVRGPKIRMSADEFDAVCRRVRGELPF